MKNVGVIGAGTMGQGIANAFATAGYNVTVCDIKIEWAQNGINKIGAKLDKLVSREKITAEKAEGIKANLTAGEYKDLADCDLIVEAVLEKMEIKKDLFKTLDEICKEDCIFGTNTSSLSVTEIANGIKHNVIGMHFFNPAEGPGFVVNRILIPMINEACFIYQEGLASVEDIDTAMKLGANHPMGPLALGDLIGLDIVLDVMEVLYTETGDPKYRPCTLLKKMVRAGKLGQKTKQGFYSYN